MRLPLLLPYAVVAALIVVASSTAIVATVRPTGPASETAPAAPPASASRAAPELSRTSRLAYWRDKRLWVSNVDGSLRYAIASVDDVRRVSLTRWSIDGSAVAYVDNGTTLFVVPTQGDAIAVGIPRALGGNGYQVKDLRWSPGGTRIAATILSPQDGRSDAYVVDLAASIRSWTRITTMEDVFIGDWISDDELLGYTAGGAIAAIAAKENGTVRLLTGAVGVSPIVGPDGRIHYLVGRVAPSRDPSFPFQTAMRASVWSAAADGSDARLETTWELNDLRLDTRLPDGRYLVHRGASNALGTVTADDVVLLPSSAGVVERVRVAPDGRTAYGSASDKIVRIDLTKLVPSPSAAPLGSVTVFLDTSGDADVWFPSQLSLARGGVRPPAAPSARYAFALGGHVWQMEKGVATLLVPGPPFRRAATPQPKWAPDGEHLLVVGQAGQGLTSALEASVVDRSGSAKPLAQTAGAGRSYAWSPSGSELAIVVDRRGQNGTSSDAQLEVRFFDPTGRATRSPFAGYEVAWTARGLYLLDDVGGNGQALRRLEGDAGARTLVTRDRLAADPRTSLGRQPQLRETPALSGLDASPDGAFVTVRLRISDPATSRAFLAILDGEGAARQIIRVDDLSDVAWSPKSTLLGYTSGVRSGTERAFVISPAGATVAAEEGRFAGWTPDGQWYLIGRAGSLYAYPVAGGSPVRLGAASAPVSAAESR